MNSSNDILGLYQLLKTIAQCIENLNKKIESTDAKIDSASDNNIAIFRELYTIITSQTNSIKDSINYNAKQSLFKEKIRCIFLVHSISMWDALSEIYNIMLNNKHFDPIILTVPSRMIGRGDFEGEEAVSNSFRMLAIPHLRLNLSDSYDGLKIIKNLSPDLIIRQQPWDGDMMPGYSAHELSFSRLISVPYAPLLLDINKNPDGPINFDKEYHRLAWRIFCDSKYSQKTFFENPHISKNKVIVSGYPKIDTLLSCKGKGIWPLTDNNGHSYRVIWAPHFSIFKESFQFGVFDKICFQFLEWVKENPDIQCIFKPHQGLKNAVISSGFMTLIQYQSYIDEWTEQKNCSVSEECYASLFDASDLMVTDGISFLAEYQFFNKPIIFFDSKKHFPFNEVGSLSQKCCDTVSTFSEMTQSILSYKNKARKEDDAILQENRKQLKTMLVPKNTSPSQFIVDNIFKDIMNER